VIIREPQEEEQASMVQNSSLSVSTQIETYTVAAEHQQAVLETLLAETNRWLSQQPGFLSANRYPSEDGRRVVSHVEWRTPQDGQNAQQNPQHHVLRARMSTLPGTTLLDSHGYTVPTIVKGPMEAVVMLPWNGEDLISPHAAIPGESQVVILHGKHTNNTISLVGVTDLPNCGASWHVHTLEDESFHVIEGAYEIQVDDNLFRAGPGATVFGPRNHKHRYRYVGESGVRRLLAIFTPAGIEDLFLAFNAWARVGKQPSRKEFLALSDHFRVRVLS